MSTAAEQHQLRQLLKLARQFDGRLDNSSNQPKSTSTSTSTSITSSKSQHSDISASPNLSDLEKALGYYSKAHQILPQNTKIIQRIDETKQRIRLLEAQSSAGLSGRKRHHQLQDQDAEEIGNTRKENAEGGRRGNESHKSSTHSSSRSRDPPSSIHSPITSGSHSQSRSTLDEVSNSQEDPPPGSTSILFKAPPISTDTSSSFVGSQDEVVSRKPSSRGDSRGSREEFDSRRRIPDINQDSNQIQASSNPFKKVKLMKNRDLDSSLFTPSIHDHSTLLNQESKEKQKGNRKAQARADIEMRMGTETEVEVDPDPDEIFNQGLELHEGEEFGKGVLGGSSVLRRKSKPVVKAEAEVISPSIQSSGESESQAEIPRAVSKSRSGSGSGSGSRNPSPFMSASQLFRNQRDEEEKEKEEAKPKGGSQPDSPTVISPSKCMTSTPTASPTRSYSPSKLPKYQRNSPELQLSPIRGDSDVDLGSGKCDEVDEDVNEESYNSDGSPRKRLQEVLKKFTFDAKIGEETLSSLKEEKARELKESKMKKEREKEEKEILKLKKLREKEMKKKERELKRSLKASENQVGGKNKGKGKAKKGSGEPSAAKKIRSQSGSESPRKDGEGDHQDIESVGAEDQEEADREGLKEEEIQAPDLSSIPIQFMRILTTCPICSIQFPKSKSGPGKSNHISICSISREPVASVEDINELIRLDVERLLKIHREEEIKSELGKSLLRKLVGENLWEEILENEERMEREEEEREKNIQELGLEAVEKQEEIEIGNQLFLKAFKRSKSWESRVSNRWARWRKTAPESGVGNRDPSDASTSMNEASRTSLQRPILQNSASAQQAQQAPSLAQRPEPDDAALFLQPPQPAQFSPKLQPPESKDSLFLTRRNQRPFYHGRRKGKGRHSNMQKTILIKPQSRNLQLQPKVKSKAKNGKKRGGKTSIHNVVAQLLGDVSSTSTILPVHQTKQMAAASLENLLGPSLMTGTENRMEGNSDQVDGDEAMAMKDIDGNLIKILPKGKIQNATPGWGGSFLEEMQGQGGIESSYPTSNQSINRSIPAHPLSHRRSNALREPTFDFSQGVNFHQSSFTRDHSLHETSVSHSQREETHFSNQRKAFLDLYHLEDGDGCLHANYGPISTLGSSGVRNSTGASSIFSQGQNLDPSFNTFTPDSTAQSRPNLTSQREEISNQVKLDRPSSLFSSLKLSPPSSITSRRTHSQKSRDMGVFISDTSKENDLKRASEHASISKSSLNSIPSLSNQRESSDFSSFRPSVISTRSHLQKPGVGLGL